jgi:uncharacterized small protein (DUF1192 family)
VKSSLRREPDVPGDLLRALFGNVTEPSHEIGQRLDDLSAQEITERITILQAEITRLEEARRAKQASLSTAAAFFKFDEPR